MFRVLRRWTGGGVRAADAQRGLQEGFMTKTTKHHQTFQETSGPQIAAYCQSLSFKIHGCEYRLKLKKYCGLSFAYIFL